MFVYGSLMSELGNHALLNAEDTEIFGGGILMYPGKMMSLGAFPGLVKTYTNISPMIGEVYGVSAETLRRLDLLEGYPSFYNREERITKNYRTVWVYYLDDPNGEMYPSCVEVPKGDWRSYCEQK